MGDIAPDTAHSVVIRDHPFEPRRGDEPWGLCKQCGLSQACHFSTSRSYIPESPPAAPPDLPPHAKRISKDPKDERPKKS